MEYTGRNTIYDYIENEVIEDGIHKMTLANNEVIDFEMVNFKEDKIFDGTDILGNDTPDTTMLIIKCHKSCTINEGVVVTPQVRKKGFVLFCNNFINYGTISMSARGANAKGQDVILYGIKGNYEIVPADGSNGGEKSGGVVGVIAGNNGQDAIERGTGGGGSGAFRGNITGKYSGAGSAGTSYSGGTGGGGCAYNDGADSAEDGVENGGAGGNAYCRRTTATNWNATGGCGNPSGKDARRNVSNPGVSNTETYNSEEGTGGLLIIYANIFNNRGIIESNGSSAALSTVSPNLCAVGGSSGGGSINIFADVLLFEGEITANGGISPEGGFALGGNGGKGSITIRTLISGTNEELITKVTLSYILSKNYRVLASRLRSISEYTKTNISDLQDQMENIMNNIIWEDSVETTSNLPETTVIGETHYVNDINSYARWNGTKWVFIGANNTNKASETLDGLMSKEDYIKLKNMDSSLYLLKENAPKVTEIFIKAEEFAEVTEDDKYTFYTKNIKHDLNCGNKFLISAFTDLGESFNIGIAVKNIENNSFDLWTLNKQNLTLRITSIK